MGVTYDGPYAEQVGYDHEGYAGQVLADGSLAAAWVADEREFEAHIPACACGWTGSTRYPTSEAGEELALGEWRRDHVQPLIDAARQSWPTWAYQVGASAREVVACVDQHRFGDAVLMMERLAERVATWSQIARGLVEEAADCEAGDQR